MTAGCGAPDKLRSRELGRFVFDRSKVAGPTGSLLVLCESAQAENCAESDAQPESALLGLCQVPAGAVLQLDKSPKVFSCAAPCVAQSDPCEHPFEPGRPADG